MTAYLLDVNVLLALVDPLHVHHEPAHRWFARRGNTAWASCPITENGLVRILSSPKYPNSPGGASEALSILRGLCAHAGHHFWADDVSLCDQVDPAAAMTHAQVTDVYLLALAVHRGGALATFDGRVPSSVVAGGSSSVELIPA
ncbi:MAG TPA: TA system VapC family ribonuclease toxin [Chloroflexota bacterium]|nr:TA system VapC family ribonuclease toxin [Chloroflexota bacterium]